MNWKAFVDEIRLTLWSLFVFAAWLIAAEGWVRALAVVGSSTPRSLLGATFAVGATPEQPALPEQFASLGCMRVWGVGELE